MHDLDETRQALEAEEPERPFDAEYDLDEEASVDPLEMEGLFDELDELEWMELSPTTLARERLPVQATRRTPTPGIRARSGRWVRRGNRIVLLGV